jgi:hypothetical protein
MPTRDYSSFASAAKPRFRGIASELGFEQVTGIKYAKQREGWYEVFALQASSYGSNFFYVNFGICIPNLCPVTRSETVREEGRLLSDRLRDVDGRAGFDNESKAAIERSALRVHAQLKAVALPWFQALGSWEVIAAEYGRRCSIAEEKIGRHSFASGHYRSCAHYGYLMFRAGRTAQAKRWLLEAERLLTLPVYFLRGGGIVHEAQKGASLQEPEPHAVKQLRDVRDTLALLRAGTEQAVD